MQDSIIKFLKEKAWIALGALLLILIVYLRNNIIDDYVQPRIEDNLSNKGYLNDKVKEGQFVSVSQKSFSENYDISQDKIIDLHNDEFVRKDSFKSIDEKLEKLSEKLESDYVEASQNLKSAEKEISELNDIIASLASNKIEVLLFISSKEIDKDYIVLNVKNRSISHLIKNGKEYYVYGDFGLRHKLKARVEIAAAEKYPENAAIGRVHEDVYHTIFEGSQAGARKATIRLQQDET